jgi:hypothetical protein
MLTIVLAELSVFRLSAHNAAFLAALVLGFISLGMAQQEEQERERAAVEGKDGSWFRAYVLPVMVKMSGEMAR